MASHSWMYCCIPSCLECRSISQLCPFRESNSTYSRIAETSWSGWCWWQRWDASICPGSWPEFHSLAFSICLFESVAFGLTRKILGNAVLFFGWWDRAMPTLSSHALAPTRPLLKASSDCYLSESGRPCYSFHLAEIAGLVDPPSTTNTWQTWRSDQLLHTSRRASPSQRWPCSCSHCKSSIRLATVCLWIGISFQVDCGLSPELSASSSRVWCHWSVSTRSGPCQRCPPAENPLASDRPRCTHFYQYLTFCPWGAPVLKWRSSCAREDWEPLPE